MHVTLAEEIGMAIEDSKVGLGEHSLKEKWLKIFENCFHRLDDEVGGFASNLDAPIAPESVGSTAAVAIVCNTHIIVANCGDSRAVLNRGKVPMPLSIDHKVIIDFFVVNAYASILDNMIDHDNISIISVYFSRIEKMNVRG